MGGVTEENDASMFRTNRTFSYDNKYLHIKSLSDLNIYLYLYFSVPFEASWLFKNTQPKPTQQILTQPKANTWLHYITLFLKHVTHLPDGAISNTCTKINLFVKQRNQELNIFLNIFIFLSIHKFITNSKEEQQVLFSLFHNYFILKHTCSIKVHHQITKCNILHFSETSVCENKEIKCYYYSLLFVTMFC